MTDHAAHTFDVAQKALGGLPPSCHSLPALPSHLVLPSPTSSDPLRFRGRHSPLALPNPPYANHSIKPTSASSGRSPETAGVEWEVAQVPMGESEAGLEEYAPLMVRDRPLFDRGLRTNV